MSQRKLRPTRKPVKYFSTEEEDINTSTDSSFTLTQQLGVSRLENRMRQVINKNFDKLHINLDDSTSSQDFTQTARKPRKNAKSMAYKNHKRVRLENALALSQSKQTVIDVDDGSDSSFLFTDEISEASFSRKEHPETLSKSVLLKKTRQSSPDKVKKKDLKRKDLSATRKASKKRKIDTENEPKIKPDLEMTMKIKPEPNLSFVQSNEQDFDQVETQPFSVEVKEEKLDDAIEIRKEKRKPDRSKTKQNSTDTREASKKRKIDTKNEPKITPDLEMTMKIKPEPNLSSVQSNEQDYDQVETQPFSVEVKEEKLDDAIEIRKEKRNKQNSTDDIKVKEEPTEKSESNRSESREKKKKTKSKKPPETDQNFNIKTEIKTEKNITQIKTEKVPETQTRITENNPTTKVKNECKLGSGLEWESNMLAELMDLDFWVAKSIISLFKNDCTVPFIARYRRSYTSNMDADQLRHVKDAYEYIKSLETKAQNVLKQLNKAGKLTKSLENSIYHVRSIEELDYIYAPYKQGSSKSKAEKARSLGLETAAWIVLHGSDEFVPAYYKNDTKQGLITDDEVVQGVQNIMADIFSKDESVLEYIHEIENRIQITVKSTKIKSDKKKTDDDKNHDEDSAGKFRLYYDFQRNIRELAPHAILALNRGENQKILSVKMQVSDSFYHELYRFCFDKWLREGRCYTLRNMMFNASFKDSYTRLITPLLTRRARSKLNRKAQQTAIENFALNLKSLLQTSPIKGCTILGCDPGIRHGVKFALISKTGDVQWTSVLHFDFNDALGFKNEQNMKTLKRNMVQHKCELIALGNGTGCRIIENIISEYLKRRFFSPELNVEYTIVNERGASIYSCSAVAKEEFPDLDPNLISAVFIARSLQDPLSEYVKVEPKHLGVGSYQHDMPVKELHQTLDEIVVECVSFTGVDVNTASVYLLKRIAGLSAARAANIIKYRRVHGSFKNREQINLVKGIGPKSYEQAAGFIRIHPQTCNVKVEESNLDMKITKKKPVACSEDINPLDRTWIHPESYAISYLFVDVCGANLADLGTQKFIDQIRKAVDSKSITAIARELNQSEDSLSLIFDALTKPDDYDYRSQFSKPIFSKGLTSIESLAPGVIVQGRVGNVTVFGAFVDIGVGKDGLIHKSNLNGIRIQIGDKVEVKILNIEIQSGRIGLYLLRKL